MENIDNKENNKEKNYKKFVILSSLKIVGFRYIFWDGSKFCIDIYNYTKTSFCKKYEYNLILIYYFKKKKKILNNK